MNNSEKDWKSFGVRVVKKDQLDGNTPSTPGMDRMAAITSQSANAQKIWAGTVSIQPNAKTAPHHHGELESIIYVLKGKAKMLWGERLEFVAYAEAGDFIFVPPFVPHQELNALEDQALECVLVRNDQEAIVVNLEIASVEEAEEVFWHDPHHPHPIDPD